MSSVELMNEIFLRTRSRIILHSNLQEIPFCLIVADLKDAPAPVEKSDSSQVVLTGRDSGTKGTKV
jgi:hypothetical protein